MEIIDLSGLIDFAGDFTGVPPERLPWNYRSVSDCIVAEAVRYAMADLKKNDDPWGRVNIISLRTWVFRKLRAIIREIRSEDKDVIGDILREPPGPNLEFMGEVLSVGSGDCIPGPTRFIAVDNERYLVVSAQPTPHLQAHGLSISITGTRRWVFKKELEGAADFRIPVQDFDSYMGYVPSAQTPESYLIECARSGQWDKLSSISGAFAYAGNQGSDEASYRPWSEGIQTDYGRIILLRKINEFKREEFWLRVDSESQKRVVALPWQRVGYAKLAYDALTGGRSYVRFENRGNGTSIVGINFRSTEAHRRCIYALGGTFVGRVKGLVSWEIPSTSTEVIKALMRRSWVTINE